MSIYMKIVLPMVVLLLLCGVSWSSGPVDKKGPAQTDDPSDVSQNPSAGEQLSWWVLGGGGTSAMSTNYILNGTVHQTAVATVVSDSYRVYHGFWQSFETAGCCVGRVGDANGEGDYPDEISLGDIMLLVDVKFVSGDCGKLPCIEEADANQDGGPDPTCEDNVTLGDIMSLVNFLFIAGPENAILPDCL
jgi:hypothetical protein